MAGEPDMCCVGRPDTRCLERLDMCSLETRHVAQKALRTGEESDLHVAVTLISYPELLPTDYTFF